MRDPGYLAFLRDECRCVACSIVGLGNVDIANSWKWQKIDPAHGPANGRGSKGPDNEAIPLCREHHDYQTEIGCMEFARRYGFNWLKEAAAHYKTYLIWKEAQA